MFVFRGELGQHLMVSFIVEELEVRWWKWSGSRWREKSSWICCEVINWKSVMVRACLLVSMRFIIPPPQCDSREKFSNFFHHRFFSCLCTGCPFFLFSTTFLWLNWAFYCAAVIRFTFNSIQQAFWMSWKVDKKAIWDSLNIHFVNFTSQLCSSPLSFALLDAWQRRVSKEEKTSEEQITSSIESG